VGQRYATPAERTARADARRAKALAEVEDLADLLDTRFSILGFRFGIDAILGLLPGIGDFATALVGLYVVALAMRAGASAGAVIAMLVNLALDAIFGFIPVLGDIFDVVYKANARNARILRKELEAKAAAARIAA